MGQLLDHIKGKSVKEGEKGGGGGGGWDGNSGGTALIGWTYTQGINMTISAANTNTT